MTTVIIVFMAFAVLICMFSVLVLTREIVEDIAEKRKQKAEAAKKTESDPCEQPTREPPALSQTMAVEETDVAEEATEEVAASDEVRFASKTTLTLEEKYLALNAKYRAYYDEIVKYAAGQEEAKRFKNVRYEEYKAGKTRLVRLLIKRGVVVCEFILPNADFKNYVNENKVSVKLAGTTMKILDETTVQAAKDSIDIVVKALEDEREYKKQLVLERRRQRRKEKREELKKGEKE
ncbi:MAG: hypothetical protein IJ317_00775 [Clostridia bacterium]|nr:hypothetical protein [Clostridia bacterium]